MSRPAASLTTLPPEIVSAIFTLSSNPSLVLTCRDLNQILAPLSKSLATRIDFLLVRYRHNYVKAVVKGLRWSFFDLELLHALDRVYRREWSRTADRTQQAARQSGSAALLSSSLSFLQPYQDTSMTPSTNSPVSSTSTTPSESGSIEPPRKKRKKYQQSEPDLAVRNVVNKADLSSSTTLDIHTPSNIDDIRIPLPKDFAMPRRLFKSSQHIPLIRILLSRGASPSHPSSYPLKRASHRGDVDMVRLLLSSGAPLEIEALRWACVEERDEVLDIFLEHGVKPDGTCLRLCVEKGRSKMIDRLLTLGVVPDLKTVLGF
ncbi:hypothetical protein EDD21DRAFT_18345 [Dissophora ornata]|nr:hypothetical protein EDD21DRAFT_18345 [Dissophora ornata]